MSESPDRSPAGLLEQWRGLLVRYGDLDEGQECYTRLRADAEATVARWVWAKAGSKLHRIEPFARELGELPEPELVAEPRTAAANLEQYGYDAQGRIVWVRTYGDGAELWWEEFLLHEADQITSIEFSDLDSPIRGAICRWRCHDGRVKELIEASGSETDGSVTVTCYRYGGERVDFVTAQRFELAGGGRSDHEIIPSYAPDGQLLELRWASTSHDRDFVVYRRPAEDLPDLASQRETLARRLIEAIAGALIAARPPDTLYGLVLAYEMSSLYVCPLFEVARRHLLGATEDGEGEAEAFEPLGLWSDVWVEPEDYLPAGVDPAAYERRVMEDVVQPLDDPELDQAFATYRRTAALVDRDEGYGAVDALWQGVAAHLTRLDWEGLLDVTDDFVVLAYPPDPGEKEIRDALQHSLSSERYAEFEAKGWIDFA